MRKGIIFVSFIGILVLSIAFVNSPSLSQEKEVRIGALYPLTGAAAKTGVEVRRLYLTLQEVINNKYPDWNMELAATEGLPNLGGAKVKMIFGDHAMSPEKGMAEAERLISSEKCVALIGTYNSSVAAAVSTVAERMKIPFVATDASSPSLTERNLKWFFRTTIKDTDYTKAFYDAVKEIFELKAGRKLTKLGLMYEDSLWGQDSAKVAKQLAQERGYQVVVDLPFRTGTTSLATEVQRLKAAQPDWIATNLFISDALLFVRTCEELNYQPPIHLSHGTGILEVEFLRMMAGKAEGYCSRLPMNADQGKFKPDLERFTALYKKLFDYPPDTVINPALASSFSGGYTLLYAINKAGSTDPQKILNALETIMVPDKNILAPTVGGGFHFDKITNIGSVPLIAQMQGGTYWTIFPKQFATREAVYPMRPLSK